MSMFILIKNQEGESMNLLSQNTDFNAQLTLRRSTKRQQAMRLTLTRIPAAIMKSVSTLRTVQQTVSALRPGICTAQTATLTGAFSK